MDETARRLFRIESKEEGFEALARSLDFQENSLAGIVDPARQAQPGRQAENKGAEADTLHRAANGHLQPRCWKSLHANVPHRVGDDHPPRQLSTPPAQSQ